MITGTVAFVAGVLLLQFQPVLPAMAWALCIPLLLWLGVFSPRLRLPAFFCTGFLWALLHAHWALSQQLVPEIEGQDVMVEGYVVSSPEREGRRLRLLFDVERLEHLGVDYASPGRVQLNWYETAPVLLIGERWRLRVRLRRPHGFMNPGGFDYEGWLFRQGIRAKGYVRQAPDNQKLGEGGAAFFLPRWRQALREKIAQALPGQVAAGLVTALVVGERDGIGQEQWEVFTRTGTNHLMAISGLHIGIVAGLVLFAVRWLWGRFSVLSLWLPAPRAAAIAALLAALIYAAMAGFAIPTRRALLMLSVLLGGVLSRRQLRPGWGLALALLLVVTTDPLAVLSAGFWLSFAAVTVILVAMSGRLLPGGLWWKLGRVQWVVAIGLFPVLLAWQFQISLIAPLVNMVVVPVMSAVVVPLALLGSLSLLLSDSLGSLLLWPAAWLLNHGFDGLHQVSMLPLAAWDGGGVPPWAWLVAAGGVSLLLLPVGIPGRSLAGILLLPPLLLRPPVPAPGELWFTLLDVGQGLSAVVRTQNHTLVYDAGPRFSPDFDAGSAVVFPFLKQAGVDRIDRLLLSNGDNDHAGGGRRLVELMPVAEVLSGEPERIDWLDAEPCQGPSHWRWDGVDFQILYPEAGSLLRGNDASCVLRVENAAGRVLLTGDIEKAAEAELLRSGLELLKADLVLVPHHGSKTSSDPAFVRAVSPEYALVSAGHANRYGFPQPAVVARWQAVGARVVNTADSGAIGFRWGADGRRSGPIRYRLGAARYWMDMPLEQGGEL
jgi:competence protein ComEC